MPSCPASHRYAHARRLHRYIDGARGVLLHRGYAIEQLARTTTFPEVVFLLVEGELPDAAELAAFEIELKSHWMVHEKLQLFYQGFKSDAHPMAIMVGVVGALSAFYPEAMNIADASARRRSAVQLVSKMPTIAALAYKTAIGEPAVYPKNKLSWAANFLHMMFATPCEEYVVDPVHAAALETIFILHADHEQNASTSTVRIASSSQVRPPASRTLAAAPSLQRPPFPASLGNEDQMYFQSLSGDALRSSTFEPFCV